MLQFDEKKLKKILMEELGNKEDKADRGIELMRSFNEQLQPILDQWMEDRTYSDHPINGVTLEMVFKHCKLDEFIKAMIHMNDFAEYPSLAEVFLKDPFFYNRRK
ncbi:hypothetical protein [Laceyella tengchongensis]|jgi:hypothetical protein|uniref:Uncharacterized protein n=1 Tax=Laceyella tengchongensis TaxID=574699 RepID=A0AA45WPS4_9BACL|nr:hypothetical protein [Laceyella tengchongensis]MRG27534.1 hypothetical protein [Laceyella tengchongensis]SMP22274.1 hypothetical protein SAMN06265361_10428 [Laceyella tengchongensis]